MTLRELVSAWNRFWFTPVSPVPMALLRIAAGLLTLQTALVLVGRNVLDWYGYHGVCAAEDVAAYWWHGAPHFNLLELLPHNDSAVLIFWYVFVAAAFCMTAGLFTRFATIIVAVSLISLNNRMPLNLNGGDTMLRLYTIYLCFSECGAAISLDRLIQRWRHPTIGESSRPRAVPFLAQRLIQLQLSLAYAGTALLKLTGSEWFEGTAVYYALRLEEVARFSVPILTDNSAATKFLTAYTLLAEGSMFTIVWIRDLRYWALASIFLLHLGIDTLMNIPVFQWIFIAGLMTFVYPEDLTKVMCWLKHRIELCFGSPLNLVYNPRSRRQLSAASVIEGLDIFGRFTIIAGESDEPITISSGEKKLTGAAMIACLSASLPALWLIYPIALIARTCMTAERVTESPQG